MPITLLTNTAALSAQRRLASSSSELSTAFTRLSSGMRINRAGDDAAGIAVASLLNADARVYGQAVRNLNDGLSYLNIAEGAVGELKSILFRLREISTQASNGVFSTSQRAALDVEVQQLQREYGRILDSTTFNNRSIFSENTEISLQLGYGTIESLTGSLGVAYSGGDGTFQAGTSYGSTGGTSIISGDVNGDGYADLMWNSGPNELSVALGNGNGSFRARTTFVGGSTSGSVNGLIALDLNGDGKTDILAASDTADAVYVLMGNGNGSFAARVQYGAGDSVQEIIAADFNGDGKIDVASASINDSRLNVLLGNGNGTFQARVSIAGGLFTRSVSAADFNGDGKQDLVTVTDGDGRLNVFLGNGNGTFLGRVSYEAGGGVFSVISADINGDGLADLVSSSYDSDRISISFGNGDGTFKARITSSAGGAGPFSVAAVDVNGDGRKDLVTSGFAASGVDILLGNADGTFRAQTSFAMTGTPRSAAFADFNGDGIRDVAALSNTTVSVLVGNSGGPTIPVPRLLGLSVRTRESALEAQSTIDSFFVQINGLGGSIGAFVSRIDTAHAALSVRRENYLSAAAQISDADIAEETARLVKGRILQQAGAAVLSQANQLPALALNLLDFR